MSGFSNAIIGGASKLLRAAIQSPNFASGSLGWSVNKDGSAEFNNIVIRNGNVVSGTSLYYNGVPALGNLIFSISATGGTDPLGNNYLGPGFYAYSGTGSWAVLNSAVMDFFSGDFAQLTNGRITSGITGAGGSRQSFTSIKSPSFNAGLDATVFVQSASQDSGLSFGATIIGSLGQGGFYQLGLDNNGKPQFLIGPDTTSIKPCQPGSPNTTETWHDMRPLLNGFNGTNAGEYPPQYRYTAEGNVKVIGTIQLPAAGGYNGVSFFTFPPAYRCAHSHSWSVAPTNMTAAPVATNWQGFPRAFVGSLGGIELDGVYSGVNSTLIRIDGEYPLDSTGTILT